MNILFDLALDTINNVVYFISLLALEQLLTELEDFLKILDKENLSSTAVVKKSFLADLLRLCTKSSGKQNHVNNY